MAKSREHTSLSILKALISSEQNNGIIEPRFTALHFHLKFLEIQNCQIAVFSVINAHFWTSLQYQLSWNNVTEKNAVT